MAHTEKTLDEIWSSLYFFQNEEIEKPLPAKGWFPLDVKALDTVFEDTYRSACKDYNRYFMCGVNLENVAGGLRGVATNGCQLALVDVPCKVKSFKGLEWIDHENHSKGKRNVDPVSYTNLTLPTKCRV